MRQEVPDHHAAAHRLVLHAEVGEVGAHRRTQIDFALLDEPHHRGGGEGLRDRRDGKHCVSRDRERIFDTGHAETANRDAAVVDDAEGNAGHAILGHLRFGQRRKGVEARIRSLAARRGGELSSHDDDATTITSARFIVIGAPQGRDAVIPRTSFESRSVGALPDFRAPHP